MSREELEAILSQEKVEVDLDAERAVAIEEFQTLTNILVTTGDRLCDLTNNERWAALHERLEALDCRGAISDIVGKALSGNRVLILSPDQLN